MSSLRYAAAAIQTDLPCPRDRSDYPARFTALAELIDHAVVGTGPFDDLKLVVFPEFAHAAPIYPSAAELLDKLALPIPNEFTDRYIQVARRHRIHIQTGSFLESSSSHPGVVFNTTCLIGPDGLLATYRKLNPWIPFEVHSSPAEFHDDLATLLPVVETEIGRLGVAICYDWLFPEVLRSMALRGCEVLIRVSAYMDPWGTTEPMDWWTVINRARAIENLAYVVAANQGASLTHYPPYSWPGGSMIVDYDGRIITQASPGPGSKIVMGPIDLDGLRRARERRQGHQMLRHGRFAPPRLNPGGLMLESLDPAPPGYIDPYRRATRR